MCQHQLPKEFLNEEGKPFEACLMCGETLNEESLYSVTKVFRNYPALDSCQLLFEHAICLVCAEKAKASLSKESLQAVQEYQLTHLSERENRTPNNPLAHCLFSEKALDEEDEFAYYGFFKGFQLMEGAFPFAVGQTAMDEMQELLSPETKDFLDDFIDTYFSGPPEWKELLKDSPVVLL